MSGDDYARITRRTLLQSGLGSVIATGVTGQTLADSRTRYPPPRKPSAQVESETAMSVRAAAEWMDREWTNPERGDGDETLIRLRGNGPPFADRPAVTDWEKAEYEGKNSLFFPGRFGDIAYDLGMMYRTEKSGVVDPPDKLTEKGLVESHRWQPAGNDWRSLRNTLERHQRGIRVRCLWLNTTLLIANKLGYKNHHDRAKEFGRVVGNHGYDVVAFCEVFKNEHATAITNNYERSSQQALAATHDKDSRLHTVIGRDPSESQTVTDVPISASVPYFHQLISPTTQGFQRHTIDLTDSDVVEGFDLFSTHLQPNQTPRGIAHRDTGFEKKGKQLNRRGLELKGKQLRDLAFFIELTQGVYNDPIETLENRYGGGEYYQTVVEERTEGPDLDLYEGTPEIPKIVVGDLNFASDQEYGSVYGDVSDIDVFEKAFRRVDLQDAWTTHGGPAGGTVGDDVTRTGEDNDDGIHYGKPYPGGRDSPTGTCYSEEFFPKSGDGDVYKQNRLDYVFIEKPKPEHNVTIDVSRMWRVPFSLKCPGVDEDVGPYADDEDRLMDHAGIGFELLVTPK